MDLQIDRKMLDGLVEKLNKSPEIFREAKRRAFEEAAPKLKQAVDSAIGGHGKVRSWQGMYIGSKGGYAAVRPKAKTFTEPTKKLGKRYAVGYVTNAINNGHRFPSPSGKTGYRPRIKSTRQDVPGRKFYQSAKEQVPKIAQETANQIVAELIKHLEG